MHGNDRVAVEPGSIFLAFWTKMQALIFSSEHWGQLRTGDHHGRDFLQRVCPSWGTSTSSLRSWTQRVWPWRWRIYVPPKSRFIILQKTAFICVGVFQRCLVNLSYCILAQQIYDSPIILVTSKFRYGSWFANKEDNRRTCLKERSSDLVWLHTEDICSCFRKRAVVIGDH